MRCIVILLPVNVEYSESIRQDVERSLNMRIGADDASESPLLLSRFVIDVGGSESLLSSSAKQSGKKTKRNSRNNSVLPLLSVYV